MSVSVLTRISSSNARLRGQYRGKRFDFLEEILRAERDASRARAREMFARVAGFPTVKTLDAPPPTQHARSYCVPTLLPLTLMATAEPSRGPYATPPIN